MKKFKWFDADRESFPSEENNIVITTVDTVIDNIVKIHTFKSMFENLECSEYFPTSLENNYDLAYGNFKDFLEKKFISISKRNKWCMMPPYYYWIIDFHEISVKMNKQQMQDLLLKNYNYYKNKINVYGDNYDLKIDIYYDLTVNKFTQSI